MSLGDVPKYRNWLKVYIMRCYVTVGKDWLESFYLSGDTDIFFVTRWSNKVWTETEGSRVTHLHCPPLNGRRCIVYRGKRCHWLSDVEKEI